jgi:hypothetical protein
MTYLHPVTQALQQATDGLDSRRTVAVNTNPTSGGGVHQPYSYSSGRIVGIDVRAIMMRGKVRFATYRCSGYRVEHPGCVSN